MWIVSRIKAYLARVFAAERFKRLFDRLARGETRLTTNELLRFGTFFCTVLFLLIYIDSRMVYYIESNLNILRSIENSSLSYIELYHTLMENMYAVGGANIRSYAIPEEIYMKLEESSQISYIIFMHKLLLQGLSIEAFGIILQVISLIRFIILASRFNLPTGLVMAIISYLASYVYYLDLVYRLKWLADETLRLTDGSLPYIVRITNDVRKIETAYMKNTKTLYTPLQQLLVTYTDNMVHEINTQGDRLTRYYGLKFYHDPFSLFVRWIFGIMNWTARAENKYARALYFVFGRFYSQIYSSYFYIIEKIAYPVLKNVLQQGYGSRYWIAYIYMVRKGKDWMPYLIRWHWTLIIIMNPIIMMYLQFIANGGRFIRGVLKPNYNSASRKLMLFKMFDEQRGSANSTLIERDIQVEIDVTKFKLDVAYNCQYVLVIALISIYVFAALHAVCGQYFFIPVFAQQIEMHAGYRRQNLSVYSGGHTSWQDLDNRKQIWHGVLGRGTDNVPLILTIFDFIKNLLTKFFRFFKR